MKAKIFLIALMLIAGLNVKAQRSGEMNDRYLKVPAYNNIGEILTANPSPAEGTLVYNLETHSFYFYNGTWYDLTAYLTAPLYINNSDGDGIIATASGTWGYAGWFNNTNTSNMDPALLSTTSGTGAAISSSSTGTGPSAEFSKGLGYSGTTALISNWGTGAPLYVSQGADALPSYFQTHTSSNQSTLEVQNLGSGKGIDVQTYNGTAGYFSSSSSYALVTGVGNVGINTSSPSSRLEVNGETKISSGNLLVTSGNLGIGIASPTYKLDVSGPSRFGGTGNLIFTSSGNVGIGTATPSEKLEIHGNAKLTTGNLLLSNGSIGVGLGSQPPAEKLDVDGNVAIRNKRFLEFGKGETKETNAGKIGYALYTSGTLDIIGAGTTVGNRKIKFWGEGGVSFTGFIETVGNATVNGFTKLGGSAAPGIKTKKITVSSSSSPGGVVMVAHGLDASKIIGVSVLADLYTGQHVPPSYTINTNWLYNFYYDNINFTIINGGSCPTGQLSICSKPITILITYTDI